MNIKKIDNPYSEKFITNEINKEINVQINHIMNVIIVEYFKSLLIKIIPKPKITRGTNQTQPPNSKKEINVIELKSTPLKTKSNPTQIKENKVNILFNKNSSLINIIFFKFIID
jgi:hypothetical protein